MGAYSALSAVMSLEVNSPVSTERKQAAATFLQFLAQPENSAWWTTQTGYLPVVNKAREDPELKKLIAEQPNYGVAIAQLENARQQDAIRLYGRNANVQIYTGLQQIYADNAQPHKVFASVAKRLEELLPGECIWPINSGGPYLFCAAKTKGKYCPHHKARLLQKRGGHEDG